MSTVEIQREGRVLLDGIAWEDYLRLRAVPESGHVRMTYDDGVLELISPSKLHERLASLLGRLIEEWTVARRIPVQGCRTMTFQRPDLRRGLEPDNCYYIARESQVRDREELDLTVDPPPDLVVEIDISSPSRRRLPIYAALGVPEVWRWRRELLHVMVLDVAGAYRESAESTALPGFPLSLATELLGRRGVLDDTALVVRFREVIGAR